MCAAVRRDGPSFRCFVAKLARGVDPESGELYCTAVIGLRFRSFALPSFASFGGSGFLAGLAPAVGVALVVALAPAGLTACIAGPFTQGSADAGLGHDAAATDAAGGDAGTGYCAAHAGQFDFCSDFDELGIPEYWSDLNRSFGGDLKEDMSASQSPPNSLLATTPAVDVSDAGVRGTAGAYLSKLGLPKGATHIAFDFRIDALDFPNQSDTSAAVTALVYSQGPGYQVTLTFRASTLGPFDLYLVEAVTTVGSSGPTYTFHPFHGALADVGTWNNVKLDFDIDHASVATSVKGTLTIADGTPSSFTLSPPIGTANLARTLIIGAQATAQTGGAKLRFDNVTYVSK
jgi:hypothetical protein